MPALACHAFALADNLRTTNGWGQSAPRRHDKTARLALRSSDCAKSDPPRREVGSTLLCFAKTSCTVARLEPRFVLVALDSGRRGRDAHTRDFAQCCSAQLQAATHTTAGWGGVSTDPWRLKRRPASIGAPRPHGTFGVDLQVLESSDLGVEEDHASIPMGAADQNEVLTHTGRHD